MGSRLSNFIEETEDGGLRVGALSRHYQTMTSPVVRARFPVLSEAIRHVAHLAIRNRGTIGGSLSHADPSAELPMMAVLLDATVAITPGRVEFATSRARLLLRCADDRDE